VWLDGGYEGHVGDGGAVLGEVDGYERLVGVEKIIAFLRGIIVDATKRYRAAVYKGQDDGNRTFSMTEIQHLLCQSTVRVSTNKLNLKPYFRTNSFGNC